MELVHVIFYVRDMERAIGFYRDTIGLELDSESEHWTTFRTGACTLALHPAEQREVGVGEPDPTFLVTDLDAEHERLTAAGVEVTEVRAPTPNVRTFDARDPDGNRFSIASV